MAMRKGNPSYASKSTLAFVEPGLNCESRSCSTEFVRFRRKIQWYSRQNCAIVSHSGVRITVIDRSLEAIRSGAAQYEGRRCIIAGIRATLGVFTLSLHDERETNRVACFDRHACFEDISMVAELTKPPWTMCLQPH